MDLHSTLSTLLNHACPAIKFRLRKEILGEDVNTLAMENLQSEIARNRSVRRALSFQHPSGSLGEVFHAGIDFNSKTQNCR